LIFVRFAKICLLDPVLVKPDLNPAFCLVAVPRFFPFVSSIASRIAMGSKVPRNGTCRTTRNTLCILHTRSISVWIFG